jgi:hypothetical protein
MRAFHRLFCAACLLWGVAAPAETRTFTESSSGRTVTAEVVSATSDNVTLKLEAGGTTSLPLSRLAEADRTYVRDWVKAHAAASDPSAGAGNAAGVAPIRYAFGVTWDKVKTGEKKVKITAYTGEEEEWACRIKVNNLSDVPLNEVELRYQIHVAVERTGNVASNECASGKDTLASLPKNQPVEITTRSVPLLSLKLDSGYITTDRSRANKRDSIKGIGLGIFHRGVLVHEYRSPGVPNTPFTDK